VSEKDIVMNKTKASLALLSNAPKRRRAVNAGPRSSKPWSQSQKIEAVLTYIATGSEVKTAAATGIPKSTLHIWRYQPWWKELQQQIQDERDDEINADISKILEKSMETVQDRLVNGDFGFNQKTGEIFRKPVNLRDAHKVTIDMIDKRNLLNGKPTSRSEKVDTNNQLDFLAKKFAEMALMSKSDLTKQINKDEIVDVEVNDDQSH
jgi:transposase-like protein